MQSELPAALNVFDTDYQLEYSESYSGTVHQETTIDWDISSVSLYKEPFESLISETYTNIILTILTEGCIAVAIYCNGNMGVQSILLSC